MRLERLELNIGAAHVGLVTEGLREIEAPASRIMEQGPRYPEHPEQLNGR